MKDIEKMPRIVRYDPMLLTAKIFASVKNGVRPKLDTNFEFDGDTWGFRGPDLLGVPEQTLLLVLIEFAGAQLSNNHENEPSWHKLRIGLDDGLLWEDGLPATAKIQTSYRELCRRCGMVGDGGSAREHVRKLLKRLCEVTIWCGTADEVQPCSRLLCWQYNKVDGVQVILNWKLTKALMGKQYSPVSLTERLALSSDAARALHCALSVRLRPGGCMQFGLEKMESYVWHDMSVAPVTRRRRHQELRASLELLQNLGNWTVSVLPKQPGRSEQLFDIGRSHRRTFKVKTTKSRKSLATGGRHGPTLEIVSPESKPKVTDISGLFK